MLPFTVSMRLLLLIPVDEVRALAPIVDDGRGVPVFVLVLGVQLFPTETWDFFELGRQATKQRQGSLSHCQLWLPVL